MADIFLSYKREDVHSAKPLVQALGNDGWTVFWDPQIFSGDRWEAVLRKELDAASCVVVLWSRRSVQSEWVLREARTGWFTSSVCPLRLVSGDETAVDGPQRSANQFVNRPEQLLQRRVVRRPMPAREVGGLQAAELLRQLDMFNQHRNQNAAREPNVVRSVALALPFFHPLNLKRAWSLAVLGAMASALAIYYLAWGRFFLGGGSAALLAIPSPLALAPVALLLLSSYLMNSWLMFGAALCFGVLHVWGLSLTAL